MPQYIAHKPRRASDENWALSLLGITAAAVLCMFAAGYFLTQYWGQVDNVRAQQQQQFDTYRRSTRPAAPAAPAVAPVRPEPSAAQLTRARLLAHPNVTPGPGFDSPGVQSTGAVIVDAIDEAQARGARR